MEIQFTTTQDLAEFNGVKCLVYGEAGSGKTVLAATAPDPFFISAEGGTLSLKRKNLVKIYGEDNSDVTYNLPAVEIHNLGELQEVYKFVRNSDDAKAFQTICIDSITEIAELILNIERNQHKDQRFVYQVLVHQMIPLIKAFRDLKGKNIYFTAKQDRFKDDVTGITTYGPGFPGQRLGMNIPYLFDEVFRLVHAADGRYLQTVPDVQYIAKDRSGSLEKRESPNLHQLFDKIANEI